MAYISQNWRHNKVPSKGNKKRDLSNKSEYGEDPKKKKKIREVSLGCTQTSQTSDIPDNFFTESLNSTDCIAILFNCLKIL